MKKCILGLLLLSSVAFADTVEVTLPHDTAEVISSDYSTGGGEKLIVYLEVLIKHKDNTYTMYTATKASAMGYIGLGRFSIPKKFKYKIDKTGNVKDEIVVMW